MNFSVRSVAGCERTWMPGLFPVDFFGEDSPAFVQYLVEVSPKGLDAVIVDEFRIALGIDRTQFLELRYHFGKEQCGGTEVLCGRMGGYQHQVAYLCLVGVQRPQQMAGTQRKHSAAGLLHCPGERGQGDPEGHEFAAFVGNQRDELEPEQPARIF